MYREVSDCGKLFVDLVDTRGGIEENDEPRNDEYYFGPSIFPVPFIEKTLGFQESDVVRTDPNILD